MSYVPPGAADSLDSYEGLYAASSTRPAAVSDDSGSGSKFILVFREVGVTLPGLSLCVAIAILATIVVDETGRLLSLTKSPISPIAAAIVLGVAVRNLVGLPQVYIAGWQFCLRSILRIAVALLGLRLSLVLIAHLGLLVIPIVAACICSALFLATRLSRGLGLTPRLGGLIAVGTSVCGVSAIVAAAPTIKADEDEVSYSVACVTLFGLLALFVYPFAAHWIFRGDATQAGLFLGTSIHDTSQVAGAGLLYQQQFGNTEALNSAMVAKLLRNLCMAAVIPLVAMSCNSKSSGEKRDHRVALFPGFIIAFILLVGLRSVGDTWRTSMPTPVLLIWENSLRYSDEAAIWGLSVAMAAVGLGTSARKLIKMGFRPLCVGFATAVLVGTLSVLLIKTASLFHMW